MLRVRCAENNNNRPVKRNNQSNNTQQIISQCFSSEERRGGHKNVKCGCKDRVFFLSSRAYLEFRHATGESSVLLPRFCFNIRFSGKLDMLKKEKKKKVPETIRFR